MQTQLTILIVLASLAATDASRAEVNCTIPMADWKPRAAVQEMAEAQGWIVRRIKIDDGCYEIRGQDAEGHPIEAKVDPATLKVISLEIEH